MYPWESRNGLRRTASALLSPWIERHEREIVRWADGHIVGSTEEAKFLHERNGVDPARVGVITQAPPAVYNLTPATAMNVTRLTTVLHVSQYAFFKAPMVVAAAMNLIAERRPDSRFIWVSGRDHHESIVALLSAGVRNRLELLDWMPQDALRQVYDRSGVFLFPSFFEGAGKVHIEALSRGLCVVASCVGGMRDSIQEGANGFIVDPGRPDALAEASLAIIGDPDRANVISQAAVRTARALSWDRAAKETVSFYPRAWRRRLRVARNCCRRRGIGSPLRSKQARADSVCEHSSRAASPRDRRVARHPVSGSVLPPSGAEIRHRLTVLYCSTSGAKHTAMRT